MPTYRVTDPKSGKKVKITGDAPPSETELDEIFAQVSGGGDQAQPSNTVSASGAGKSDITTMQAMFPRATREGASLPQKIGGAALDLSSFLGRAVDSGRNSGTFAYPNMQLPSGEEAATQGKVARLNMADTEGHGLGKFIRDPALLPALATGAGVAGLATKAGLTGLGAATAAGAVQGAGSAAIHQADNAVQGRKVDLNSAGMETAIGAALPVAGAVVAGGAKLANKYLGRLAEGLSGVSEEALRIHGSGFGQGAKDLAAAAGKQREIGSRLADALDNLDDYLPEKQVVDAALPNIPPVSVQNTVASLHAAKTGGALKSSRDVNAKIDEVIADLTGAADETGHIPAIQFREIRKEIDGLIGDAFGKESNKYVSALKDARHTMAADLVGAAEASGNPQYIEAMKTMADKLQKADKLSQFLGKNSATRENRAQSFISTLFGKNKAERQEAVKAMGEIFGDDFLAQAKMSHLAAELGDEGRAGLLPRQWTGRAALGPGLAALSGSFVSPVTSALPLALSSPRAAGMVLAGSNSVAKNLARDGLQQFMATAGRYGTRPIFRGLGDDEDAP